MHYGELQDVIAGLKTAQAELLGKLQQMEQQRKDEEILDLTDLQKILKVSRRTLFNWRDQGILPLCELGGKLYITRAALYAALEGSPKLKKGGRYA